MEGSQRRSAAGLQGVDPGGRSWSCCAGSSSSACSPTAPTWRTRRCPQRVVDAQGRVLYTGKDISARASRSSCTTGSWSTGRRSATAPTSGPDFTADYLRRSSDLVTRSYGGAASDSAARRTIADFRTNRYDERTKTLTLTAAAGRTRSARSCRTTAGSSPTRRPSTACAPTRSPTARSCAS